MNIQGRIFDFGVLTFGILTLIVGFLKGNLIILFSGIGIITLSLALIQISYRNAHLTSGQEEKIVKDVDFILRKEKEMKKIEGMLKKDVEEVYNKALHIDSRERVLSEREKQLIDTETKLHKSLKMPSEEELKTLFIALDDLFGKLPDSEIEKFADSKEFEIYKKLMDIFKK